MSLHYLNEYRSFNSTQELNYHVKQHTNKRYYDMNETQRKVLQVISQYAVNNDGACHLRMQTVADAVGRSTRTIERVLKVLERLNIIEVINTTRPVKGGQGANIYRILPYDVEGEVSEGVEVGKPTDDNVCTSFVEKETAISLSNKSSNTLLDTATSEKQPSVTDIIKRSLRNAMPASLYDALSPFFNGQELYDIYGILLRAKSAIDRDIRLEDYAAEYMDVFYNVIRLYKQRKVRNLNAYLYTAWECLTARIDRSRAVVPAGYYDWTKAFV